jgi:hypothetical protein
MKTILLASLLAATAAGAQEASAAAAAPSPAQTPAAAAAEGSAAAAPVADKTAAPAVAGDNSAAVAALDRQIAARQVRVTALVNQIVELDGAIETAINDAQEMLKRVTDSKESNTAVARLKREVMKKLEKAALYYDQKRATVSETLRTSKNKFEREDLFKDRSAFDDRINKRIEGIVDLALSMDSHKEYEQYLQDSNGWDGYGWRGGVNGVNIRRNPEYDQNKKATRQTDAATKEIMDGLSKSLARLDVHERDLKNKLAAAKGEAAKQAVQVEIDRVKVLKQQRYEQMEEVGSSRAETATPIGRKEAQRLEDLINEIAANARRDFQSLFARYNELKSERTALARLELRREAMTQPEAEAAPAAPAVPAAEVK